LLITGASLIAPLALIELRTRWVLTVGLTLGYLGYGCILIAFVYTRLNEGWIGRILSSLPARAVGFVGFYSYSIYLWHDDVAVVPMRRIMQHGFLSHLPGELQALVYLAATVVIATVAGVILGTVVERPTLALRDYFFPSRVAAPVLGGNGPNRLRTQSGDARTEMAAARELAPYIHRSP
jgi:peptidoglycan/LPS O-acetylase OafA/YrhL